MRNVVVSLLVTGLALAAGADAPKKTAPVAEFDRSLSGPGWRFAKDPDGALRAEAERFDDSAWEEVRVPHDWAISGPFDGKLYGGSGKLPWCGVGWYRRTFTLPRSDGVSTRVFLDFDGVMSRPEVYVNGRLAGGWNYGYASFRVNASSLVRFGGTNTVAVRADTRTHESRWYPGAGIYRDVTLRVRDKLHFAYNGIFVSTPEVSRERARVRVQWEPEGSLPPGAKVTVKACGVTSEAPASAMELEFEVVRPELWDVDSPKLHTAEVSIADADGVKISGETVRFGIRSIAFPVPAQGAEPVDRAAVGFHLNGRRVQLRGVNLHSDLGLLGMAFDKSAMRRQLVIMKDMGVNAIRTSHNIPAPGMLDLCDEMGFVVWDEALDKWDSTISRRKDEDLDVYVGSNLRAFVRRDRNHPSVVAWSMSNEILSDGTHWHGVDCGLTRARCRYFREVMRLEDATRPIGNGNICDMCGTQYVGQGIFDDLDIVGWNYRGCYEPFHRQRPDKPIFYTESASAFSCYGHYPEVLPDDKRQYTTNTVLTTGYDFLCGPDIADWEFRRMEKDAYVCGEFVWTGFDYLGEPCPNVNKARSSSFGIVDLTGVPKDRYYLYRSYWRPEALTAHILPHWTWPDRRGKPVPVFVYTNGDSAELFLNGRSMGLRRKGEDPKDDPGRRPPKYFDVCRDYRLMWYGVPYEPGELKAVCYKDGRKIGETTMRTAGSPAALRLTPEKKLTADPAELLWVQVDVLDWKGVRNPLATDRVRFTLNGPGRILGVGNGDPAAMEAFTRTESHPLFYGRAMAVVRREGPGRLTLGVSAKGLKSAAVDLQE